MSQCWCDRYKASGGGKCEPCQARSQAEELERLRAENALLRRSLQHLADKFADEQAEIAEHRSKENQEAR